MTIDSHDVSMKQYTINQLNKLANKDIPVIIYYGGNIYHLDYFVSLEDGEDYYDPKDENYQWDDGTPCNVVAYVKDMPEHIPLPVITKIFVGGEIEIK
jgi:predicted heme/steroid binding protein